MELDRGNGRKAGVTGSDVSTVGGLCNSSGRKTILQTLQIIIYRARSRPWFLVPVISVQVSDCKCYSPLLGEQRTAEWSGKHQAEKNRSDSVRHCF